METSTLILGGLLAIGILILIALHTLISLKRKAIWKDIKVYLKHAREIENALKEMIASEIQTGWSRYNTPLTYEGVKARLGSARSGVLKELTGAYIYLTLIQDHAIKTGDRDLAKRVKRLRAKSKVLFGEVLKEIRSDV